MQNEVPLQKQILDLQLGKGQNERDRPETADPTSTFSRMENLVQDQTGAMVKRYGTPILGSVNDDNGVSIGTPVKLLRLRGGLGMVNSAGKFYQYMENNQRFTNKDEMPDFVVAGADQICSSGPNVSPKLHAVASSTKYHAVIHEAGLGVASDNGYRLVFYERASVSVVANIDIGTVFGFAGTAYKMLFAGDRYLHIFSGRAYVCYDTAVNPIAPVAAVANVFAAGTTVTDIDVNHASTLVFALGGSATPNYLLQSFSAAGVAQTNSGTVAGTATQLAIDPGDAKIWYYTTTQRASRSTSSLVTVVDALAGTGCAATDYPIVTSQGTFIITQTAPAFGATTISAIQCAGAIGATVAGWKLASKPFADAATGNVYVHAFKDAGLSVAAHAVLKLSFRSFNLIPGGNSYSGFRLAADLEPMLGVLNSDLLKYFPTGTSTEFCPMLPIQTVARGFAYCAFSMKPFDYSRTFVQTFGGQNYISGAVPCVYGGNKIQESGFVDMPTLNCAVSASAGPTGSFKTLAVYRYVDETGAVTWSRCSLVASTTTAAKGIDMVVNPCTATLRDVKWVGNPLPNLQSVEVYRTQSGGTQFYLCASSQIGTPATGLSTQVLTLNASGFFAATDTMTDAVLAVQPLLFRQPGTANSAVDRYPPPPGNILCQHKDRLFTTDPYGIRVYYSSFFVDGETAWYNPVFSFFVHGGSGPITAMVSMDGRLFVFKRDGIFVVDGDGPPEGGVSGNEYSPPQRLATEYGCLDARSVVVTTDGIMYRSARGIELLTRSLQVKWVGDRLQNTVLANSKITGAVLDTFARVHICMASADTGTVAQTATSGVECIYDFTTDSWTVSHHTDNGGTYDRCVQDVVQADLAGKGEVLCYADPSGAVCYTDATSGLDRGSRYVPWTIETAWIRTGQQARARFSRAMLLAKKLAGANHKITISAAYNFVDGYTQTFTWEPGVINAAAIEELTLQLNTPSTIAVRLLIQEAIPTDTGTYPVGTGRGCDLLGLSLEIAQKTGAPRAADTQKG